MRALYNMLMKIWTILGFDGPTIICSKNNIGGMGCNYRLNNLFFGAWCVIKYDIIRHTNTPTIALTDYGVELSVELGFC